MTFAASLRQTGRTVLKGAGAAALAGVLVSGALSEQALAQTAIEPQVVVDGLSFPWAVAFLPDGGYLITERDGVLKYASKDGSLSDVPGTPEVFSQGQGGLLDIALAPDFHTSSQIFMTYSDGSPEGAGTSVFRARLVPDGEGYRLADGETIFTGNNTGFGGRHFGSRLAFADDGTLFFTTGDRGDGPRSQDPADHSGNVLRINQDGSVPGDNPFVGQEGHRPEIWSTGHRNPQSAAINPATGELWTVEHGARGGDELNKPEAGKNYGWPVISYGRHYSGGKIGVGNSAPGYEQPLYYWDPSIAPSGMAFVTSDLYPDWQGSLLVGALRGQHLARLSLDGETVTGEEKLLTGLDERIRDVRQGPDGMIYVLTDNDPAQLLRLVPQTTQ
ncbi:PQQ-dependent sugar dehydrogenase [Roseibium sp. RKSG952]|uniref:PQQ-dependent sugar dehydrogenase n=1 Tax=Roseibium sp. RKSG952 TaxID=2529384 RepID=UPI0012BCFF82|nr:PQQ-dependent sugar dehydrogenase [Roseibium sp. RKSG952]MTH96293.1 PQQ-dependent sugar dehydrogenase [Roseibium sp. RKSG952]